MSKLTDIKPQARNANRHTQRGMGALEASIQSDGWIGAITVAADGETFDGSARIEVGAATGFDEAIVIESDGSKPVVVVRKDIPTADDPRAVRLGIAANRVASLNLEWESGVLAELAGEMDLSGLFFPHELANLAQQYGEPVDPTELWKGMPEFEQEDLGSWKSINVHFANEDDYHAFARLVNQTLTPQTKYIWYPYKEKFDHLDYKVEDES